MSLVRSPVRSVVGSPARSLLGDLAGGGGGAPAFDLTTLSRYVDLDVKNRANLDGSGSNMTTITDQGSAGLDFAESPFGDGFDYDDTAGTNNGAPGAVRLTTVATNRLLWTGDFTAGTLPNDTCWLWIGRPSTQASYFAWFHDNNARRIGQSVDGGLSTPGLNVGDHYVNQQIVTTQNELHDQSALTDGNDTYPFSYFRAESAQTSGSTQIRFPLLSPNNFQNLMLARLLVIDQSEYDANKDGIDAAMIALRDEYRAG
jgi:hypothetical protein